jgi:hypothetical protein
MPTSRWRRRGQELLDSFHPSSLRRKPSTGTSMSTYRTTNKRHRLHYLSRYKMPWPTRLFGLIRSLRGCSTSRRSSIKLQYAIEQCLEEVADLVPRNVLYPMISGHQDEPWAG